MKGKALIHSVWNWEHIRKGKVIDAWDEKNVCMDEGLSHLLGVGFSGETQKSNWYLALFEDDYTPLITDTYASPGFTESVAYDESNRPGWEAGPISSKQIGNSHSKAEFTMNATKTIYGGALVSAVSKGDANSGEAKMYSASKFSQAKAVEDDDTLRVTCTLEAEDS